VFHCEREAEVEERSPALIELRLRIRLGVGGREDEIHSISNRNRTIFEMWFPLLSGVQQSDASTSAPLGHTNDIVGAAVESTSFRRNK
jgi:hypothetical protein